jgi:lipid A oxidase
MESGIMRMRIRGISAIGFICFSLAALPAAADPVLSVYGGYQTAPHSNVSVSDGTEFTAGWEGQSFEPPPYWGVRGTWWLNDFGHDEIGLAIDFSHTKVYADKDTLNNKTPGWTHFEFTDGLNLLTANVLYRFQKTGRAWTPYVGIGAGVDIPHVEVTRPSGKTWDYQLGGISGQLMAGIDYRFTEHISAFTEYKLNYSHVNVDIDSGDTLKTNLLTHAINVGISYHF